MVGTNDHDVDPVYLLSSERSGSNLVRSILNTHSTISAPHPLETAYPRDLGPPDHLSASKREKFLRDVLINKAFSFHPLTVPLDIQSVAQRVNETPAATVETVQQAMYEECCKVESTSMWVSKYPGLWDLLPSAFDHYDDLRIVYLVRDPRDVVLSFKRSNIDLYHPYFSAQRWREEQRRGIDLLDSREFIHLVRYQDLLEDPEDETEAICDFLGLEFEEAMLYYYETEDAKAASESSALMENLSIPIKQDNYGKFREELPPEELKITEKLVGDELRYFGFEPVYTEEEIESFSLKSEAEYGEENKNLARNARLNHWRENPREQLRRQMTWSFTAYIYLRYGVLA